MPEETTTSSHDGVLRWLRHIVVVTCMLGFLAMLAGIGSLLITGNHPARRDVISYWAAARQIATHTNPYGATAVQQLERSAGFFPTAPVLIMRNPPYALPLVLPLSPFQLRAASLVWSLMLLASLAISIHLLWAACGRPPNKVHLLGYTFAPALACVMTGQTGLFALLGLVLFLRLHRDHGFAAGVALWLCALKPHLFLPFGAALLLWAITSRRFRILTGAALALLATSALATWLDPSAWQHYSAMMHSPNLQQEVIPSLSYELRALHPSAAWLQYLPAAAGCCWAVWFCWHRRASWNWLEDGALLMLVSLAASPYAWLTDHAILIPALLVGVYRATTRIQLAVLALASLLIEIAQFKNVSMHSLAFMFVPLFWLGWYLYVTRQARLSQATGAPGALFAQSPAFLSL